MAMLFHYPGAVSPRRLVDRAVHVLKVFRSPVSAGLGLAIEIGDYRLHLSQHEAERLATELTSVIMYNEQWQASHERSDRQEAS